MTARPPRPPMLTVAQAAGRLGITPMQAYRYIAAGLLDASRYPSRTGKPNGPVRVEPDEVERFIKAHSHATTTSPA